MRLLSRHRAVHGAALLALFAGTFGAVGCQQAVGTYAIEVVRIPPPEAERTIYALLDRLEQTDQVNTDLLEIDFDADGVGYIFYGEYTRYWDAMAERESYRPDPRPDLQLIRDLTTDRRNYPFRLAQLVSRSDLARANVDWDARYAPGFFSVQVAAFENRADFSNRKQAAEQYCAQLRAEGHEAYFHHGVETSTVLVGSFPESAIQQQRVESRRGGTRQDGWGRIDFVQPRVVDARMRMLLDRFPNSLYNGSIAKSITRDRVTGKRVETPMKSFVVRLPAASGSAPLRDAEFVD